MDITAEKDDLLLRFNVHNVKKRSFERRVLETFYREGNDSTQEAAENKAALVNEQHQVQIKDQ